MGGHRPGVNPPDRVTKPVIRPTAFRLQGTEHVSMAAVIEIPQLESWFLVDWPDAGMPSVMMEFGTRTEAEDALRAAFRDAARANEWGLRLTVRSALAMLEQPELREALAAWDLEFSDV